MGSTRETTEKGPRRADERVAPRLVGPLPSHDEVSLDVIEATLWRLLAGRYLRRSGTDVAWLVGLVQRYAEAYAGRLARDGVSSSARLAAGPRLPSPGCELGASGAAAASVVEQSPTRSEVAAAASRLNGSAGALEQAVEGFSKRCRDCQELKELTEFYASTTNKDGRKGTCKACQSAQRKRVRDVLNHNRAVARQRRVFGE
jgi:hypothetical protein